MEKTVTLQFSGQEVGSEEVNAMGEGGLMDDRLLAELLRIVPFDGTTTSRGIFPYRFGRDNGPTVGPDSTGVIVSPFRVFVGSRTAESDDAKANWQDLRSGVWVGSTTSLTHVVALSTNSSGNPRFDLIWAAFTIDNPNSVTRYIKDTTTKTVSPTAVSPIKTSGVVVGVSIGTPGATPAFPATPSDVAGPPATYYVPLAYVRVPTGYVSGGAIASSDVIEAAVMFLQSTSTGVSNMHPGNGCHGYGTGLIASADMDTWRSAGTKPAGWIQRSMIGVDAIHAVIPASTTTGSVIDNTRDWRGRHFKVAFQLGIYDTGAGRYVPSEGGATSIGSPTTISVPLLAAGFVASNYLPYFDGFQDQTAPLGGGGIWVPISQILQDRKTLVSVSIDWQVTGTHLAVPTAPKLSIIRSNVGAASGVTLNSGDTIGLPLTLAGTVGAYDASHVVQSFTYVCNRDNLINRAIYGYHAYVVGEDTTDAVAGNAYMRLNVTMKDTVKSPSRIGFNNFVQLANSIHPSSHLTGAGDFPVVVVTPDVLELMTSGVFGVYVDVADGALKVFNSSASPSGGAQFFLWLEATGPSGPL